MLMVIVIAIVQTVVLQDNQTEARWSCIKRGHISGPWPIKGKGLGAPNLINEMPMGVHGMT